MTVFAGLLAAVLYLSPLLLLLALRSPSRREPWQLVLWICTWVSADLLLILLACHLVRLEAAVLLSRPLWWAGIAAWHFTRGRREEIDPGLARISVTAWAAVLLCALSAAALSHAVSRAYAIWDVSWHIPLVSSLRAQALPFRNIFQPDRILNYHFSGDVLAAELQSLSFSVVHAAHALTLTHDILFGLCGACLALLMLAFGFKPLSPVFLGAWAVLLTGPVSLFRESGHTLPFHGYSYLNFFTMSFRPHVPLAALMFIGVVAVVAVRLQHGAPVVSSWVTTPVLLSCMALLAVSDEASTGLLGIALGTAWLVQPELLHKKRLVGVAILIGLLVAVAVPHLVFSAALSPGGPASDVRWVPARLAGYLRPSLALGTAAGLKLLLADMGALFTGVLLLGALAWKLRSRNAAAAATFSFTLVVLSTVGLTSVEVNHVALESHRFTTAAVFFIPILVLTMFQWLEGHSVARAVATGVLALPAMSTAVWLSSYHQFPPWSSTAPQDFHAVNCRSEVDAKVMTDIAPTYLEPSVWYLVAGCAPVYAPGASGGWSLSVFPQIDKAAFAELHANFVASSAPLSLACPHGSRDPICLSAGSLGKCAPSGGIQRCTLSGADRRQLLGMREESP
jgi:hypothetical protein